MTREPKHPGETLGEDPHALGMSTAEVARRIERYTMARGRQ